MKKRIIFLNDIPHYYYSRYAGPYVLASILNQNGYDAIVIDNFLSHPNLFSYLESFIHEDTVMVGISSTFLSPKNITDDIDRFGSNKTQYYNNSLWFDTEQGLQDWSEQLRNLLDKKAPNAKIVLGVAKAQQTMGLESPHLQHFDYVLLGYSDTFIMSLVDALCDNHEPAALFQRTKYKTKYIKVKREDGYTQVPKIDWLEKYAIQSNEPLPIEITRGCVYSCKFCYFDKKYSDRKNLQLLKDEFLKNYEKYGTIDYHFCDDCFNDTREKVESVCNTILSLPFKINWVSYARADLAVKFPETYDLMVESGAKYLMFGLETFNHEAGKLAGKGVPPEKIKNMLIETRKKHYDKCMSMATFIIGLPKETKESQIETFNWLKENPVLDLIDLGTLSLIPVIKKVSDVVDFPDYAQNPQKYGFKRMWKWGNRWEWQHDTMSSFDADELIKVGFEILGDKIQNNSNGVFSVMGLRKLGFSWNEIFNHVRKIKIIDSADMKNRNNVFLEKYFSDLRKNN